MLLLLLLLLNKSFESYSNSGLIDFFPDQMQASEARSSTDFKTFYPFCLIMHLLHLLQY